MNRVKETLTGTESDVKSQYEANGWMVLRSGGPDFLMYHPLLNEVLAVEVKKKPDILRPNQILYRKILERAGVPFHVEMIQRERGPREPDAQKPKRPPEDKHHMTLRLSTWAAVQSFKIHDRESDDSVVRRLILVFRQFADQFNGGMAEKWNYDRAKALQAWYLDYRPSFKDIGGVAERIPASNEPLIDVGPVPQDGGKEA